MSRPRCLLCSRGKSPRSVSLLSSDTHCGESRGLEIGSTILHLLETHHVYSEGIALVQVEVHLPDRVPFSDGCKVLLQGPHSFRICGINPQLGVVSELSHLAGEDEVQVIDMDKKRRGPKTDPWGTSLLTAVQSEGTPLTMTFCLLNANQFSIQASTLPRMPMARTFLMNLLWRTLVTLPKALRKSKTTTSTALERSHSQNTYW